MLPIIYRIYQFSNNGFYIVLLLGAMSILFQKKKAANWFIYYVVPTVLFWVIYYLPEYIIKKGSIPYYYYFVVSMAITLIWITIFLEGSFFRKTIYYVYYYAFYKCIVFFLGGVFYKYEFVINRNIYMIFDMLSCTLIMFILLLFVRFFVRHPLHITDDMNRFQLALMLVSPISFFAILQMFDPSVGLPNEIALSLAAVLLMINVPVIFYLYTTIGDQYESRYKLNKALTETSAQLTRYRYTILIEEQARSERHELKNNYFYIQTLLKEKKYDQLDSFISDHIGELSDGLNGIHTNNMLIDHILNTKLNQAHKYNIKTYSEIIIPEELLINENYFCTILLNLLDNAIEASQKEQNPDIQVLMNVKNHYLVCVVKNKVHSNILENNPNFETTKKDKKKHGLGMKIIHNTVKKANAIFDTTMEGNYFIATLMMPIEHS